MVCCSMFLHVCYTLITWLLSSPPRTDFFPVFKQCPPSTFIFFVVSVVVVEPVCLIMVTFWSMSMLPVATQLQTISVTLPQTANYINPRQSWRYVNSCPFYGGMWVIQADI